MHGLVDGWEVGSRERELGSRERERHRKAWVEEWERERRKGLNWAVSESKRISTYEADTGVVFRREQNGGILDGGSVAEKAQIRDCDPASNHMHPILPSQLVDGQIAWRPLGLR